MCPRCGGLVIKERSYDVKYEGFRYVIMDKCLICGNVEDATVINNRRLSGVKVYVK